MSHHPVIPKTDNCEHEHVYEYWHDCSIECAVNECQDCGAYATDCEDTWHINEKGETNE